jgi:hypothetical protein
MTTFMIQLCLMFVLVKLRYEHVRLYFAEVFIYYLKISMHVHD